MLTAIDIIAAVLWMQFFCQQASLKTMAAIFAAIVFLVVVLTLSAATPMAG
jgi:hypothetical protein